MTVVTINTGSGTQQWTPPGDCTTIDMVEMWGAGGSGTHFGHRCTGGGAGAYTFIAGPILVSSIVTAGTVPYQVGAGGLGQSTNGVDGLPGTETWFVAITTYKADFGLGGKNGASGTTAGGVGGLAANCIPSANGVAGGSGGTDSSATGASGGGASGSGNGAGVSAPAVTTTAAGAGATAPAGGGNGGAASITSGVSATSGSTPGGGGGALNATTGSSGAGGIGQIVITYTPAASAIPYQPWYQLAPILAQ